MSTVHLAIIIVVNGNSLFVFGVFSRHAYRNGLNAGSLVPPREPYLAAWWSMSTSSSASSLGEAVKSSVDFELPYGEWWLVLWSLWLSV